MNIDQDSVVKFKIGDKTVYKNKLSKIYHRDLEGGHKFSTTQEAIKYFLTKEAILIFKRYCLEQTWALTEDNLGLHWSVSFLIFDNKENNSILWQKEKEKLTRQNLWFKIPPVKITHEALHLF